MWLRLLCSALCICQIRWPYLICYWPSDLVQVVFVLVCICGVSLLHGSVTLFGSASIDAVIDYFNCFALDCNCLQQQINSLHMFVVCVTQGVTLSTAPLYPSCNGMHWALCNAHWRSLTLCHRLVTLSSYLQCISIFVYMYLHISMCERWDTYPQTHKHIRLKMIVALFPPRR